MVQRCFGGYDTSQFHQGFNLNRTGELNGFVCFQLSFDLEYNLKMINGDCALLEFFKVFCDESLLFCGFPE